MPNIPYAGTEILDADDVSYAESAEFAIDQRRYCTFCGHALAERNGGETCYRHLAGVLPRKYCAVCGRLLAEHSHDDTSRCRETSRSSAPDRAKRRSDDNGLPLPRKKLSPEEIAAYSDDILEAVHRVYNIRVTDLWGTMLTGLRLEVRQVAVYLLCNKAKVRLSRRVVGSLVHIDETSAYYCCQQVEKAIKQEEEVANRIRQIEKILEEI